MSRYKITKRFNGGDGGASIEFPIEKQTTSLLYQETYIDEDDDSNFSIFFNRHELKKLVQELEPLTKPIKTHRTISISPSFVSICAALHDETPIKISIFHEGEWVPVQIFIYGISVEEEPEKTEKIYLAKGKVVGLKEPFDNSSVQLTFEKHDLEVTGRLTFIS